MLTTFNLVIPVPFGHYLKMKLMADFLRDEQGQDLIEYTLLVAFVTMASASIYVSAGTNVKAIWNSANTTLGTAATSAS